MSLYIEISQSFAEQNANYKSGVNAFGFAITKDGRYVCDANSKKDFPELFSGSEPEIELSIDDFNIPTE